MSDKYKIGVHKQGVVFRQRNGVGKVRFISNFSQHFETLVFWFCFKNNCINVRRKRKKEEEGWGGGREKRKKKALKALGEAQGQIGVRTPERAEVLTVSVGNGEH